MPNHPHPSTPQPTDATSQARLAPTCPLHELTAPLATADHQAIAALRRLARSALTAWHIPHGQDEDMLVVLSELATNALSHTDGPALIRLRLYRDRLILEVTDTSTAMPEFNAVPDNEADQPHGYGLSQIVTALADSVTATPNPGCGKTITATLTIKNMSI